MEVDRFFKQLERRTERDLYRRTSRAVFTSQRNLINKVAGEKKVLLSRSFAIEILWFFVALLVGFLVGYILFSTLEFLVGGDLYTSMIVFFGNEAVNLFYALSLLCFIGVYITRLTLWAFLKV